MFSGTHRYTMNDQFVRKFCNFGLQFEISIFSTFTSCATFDHNYLIGRITILNENAVITSCINADIYLHSMHQKTRKCCKIKLSVKFHMKS